ncbi:MAG: hypothetical protein IT361_04710 [Gemmatimonadaceae bacterium]|nr:hypothetical protein [Gemmatimonadaceae bacterium]
MNKPPNLKHLQKSLLRDLAEHLGTRGFRARFGEQTFVKIEADFTWVVHVAFIRHEDDVDATLDLGLRLGAAQELLEKSGHGDRKGVTIGAELGNLIDGRPRRWSMRSELDASEAAREMFAELEKFGYAWFERYSDLEYVRRVLAANDRESRLVSPLPANRCLTAVALAALTSEEAEARAVADQCREYLKSRNDPQLPLFDRHVSHILAGRPNP